MQCTMTLEHGAPVEATAFLPGGSLLATAGGTEIRCLQPLQSFLRSTRDCTTQQSVHLALRRHWEQSCWVLQPISEHGCAGYGISWQEGSCWRGWQTTRRQ